MSDTPFDETMLDTKKAADFLGYDVPSFRASLTRLGLEPTRIAGVNHFHVADLEKIKAGRIRQKYGSGYRWIVPTPCRG